MPYLDSIHVAKSAQGKGVARALLSFVARELRDAGRDELWLHVLEGNHGARKAYAALGGREESPIMGDCFGHPVLDVPVIWNGLESLLEK